MLHIAATYPRIYAIFINNLDTCYMLRQFTIVVPLIAPLRYILSKPNTKDTVYKESIVRGVVCRNDLANIHKSESALRIRAGQIHRPN